MRWVRLDAGCGLVVAAAAFCAACSTEHDGTGNARGMNPASGVSGAGAQPAGAGQVGATPAQPGAGASGGGAPVGQAGTPAVPAGAGADPSATAGTSGAPAAQAGMNSDPTAGAGGSEEPPVPADCQKGVVSASQVILIGDSYLAAGAESGGIGGIQEQIEKRAVEAGALDAGEHYRNYYIGGTRFLNNTIQDQYTTTAKGENADIKVVLMDGGGNDVLQGLEGCSVFNDPMEQICIDVVERSTAAAHMLM